YALIAPGRSVRPEHRPSRSSVDCVRLGSIYRPRHQRRLVFLRAATSRGESTAHVLETAVAQLRFAYSLAEAMRTSLALPILLSSSLDHVVIDVHLRVEPLA